MKRQATIRRSVRVEGVGLHSGLAVQMQLCPAAADTGIVFRAADGTLVPANAAHVVDGHYATTVGAYGVRIRTIEHLMAAAAGLGIDNLLVELSGDEVPGLDGSARAFVELLESAGKVSLPAHRRALAVQEPVRVEEGSRFLQVMPADSFRISYTLDHEHPAIGLQVASFEITESAFVEEIAPARTYGFLRDVGVMRRAGLARGGSLENVVVIGRRAVLNDRLRFPDEFVRHKVLDLIGDLALLGRPLVGHVLARNGGHALNHRLVEVLAQLAARESRQRVGGLTAPAPALPELAAG
jgi:UDP-3-O-[3-hydroxymyristoyl] N-acetylglucosamine deacetylase